jgi:hypothetical protein
MPCGVSVDLEVVDGVDNLRRLQHVGTKRHHVFVRCLEVVDPQVEVNLLRRRPVGPIRRYVVRGKLDTNPRCAIDGHHVPVILFIHGAVEDSCPEAALGSKVCGIEDDDLVIDAHPALLPNVCSVYDTLSPAPPPRHSLPMSGSRVQAREYRCVRPVVSVVTPSKGCPQWQVVCWL